MPNPAPLPELSGLDQAKIDLEIRALEAGRNPFQQACVEVQIQNEVDEMTALYGSNPSQPEQELSFLGRLGHAASTSMFMPIPFRRS